MAGGGIAVQSAGGRNYEGGLTGFVITTCLVAAMGGLLFGYDLGISGGVTSMEHFLKKFFPSVYKKQHNDSDKENAYCKFDSQLLTLFTSSLYLAALIACFFASVVTRVYGRKASMSFGGFAFLIGAIINGVASNIIMLIVGRLLLGVGVGFANQSVPVFLSEMAPAKVRGALNIGFQMAITIGILIANLVNFGTVKISGGWGWRVSLALAAVPAVMMTLTGINVIMFYAPVLFKTIGFGDDASLMSAVISGGVNVVATAVSIYCVDKFGRRILFLQGGMQMLISQILVGVMIALKFGLNGTAKLSKADADVILFLICLYVAAFAWSWGPLGWLVPSEICPLEIRSAAQAINVSVNMLFTFIIAQVFLTMLCHMKFGLFFFFAGFVVIMTIFVFLFVPETKNVPIEEMGSVWKNHWFWCKYCQDY
ncbi:hypothetical protein Q3G72_011014 [Acer saccharum]|nr:hypothetical protein Q3G72_011014 [Acer saccharum]